MDLKLIYRLIIQQKAAVFLNIFCLSIAFAVLYVVLKQAAYDFSFDRCYPKGEDIYQLGYWNQVSGTHEVTIAYPVIQQTLDLIPEVEAYTILLCDGAKYTTFYYQDQKFSKVAYMGVSPGYMQVFQPRIVAGDVKEAFRSQDGLIIPSSLSRVWFGDDDPINQRVGFGAATNQWTVKAVYQDFPENSSMVNGVLYCLPEDKDWTEWSYLCFLRAYPGIEGKCLEEKIERMTDTVFGEGNPTSAVRTFGLTSMKDVYFSPDIQIVLKSTGHGNRELTWCLLLVGVLIIVVAYINFINFSTALAPARIGTLNICKITGASVFNLRFTIILEAVLLSVGAWLIAVVWVYIFSVTDLAKTYFSCSLNPFENILLYISLGGCSILFGILSGLYPAYYMTTFQPAMVLKGRFGLSRQGRKLRNGLLIFQFVVTMVLIVIASFIMIQRNYLTHYSWGYSKENVIYAPTNKTIEKSLETFREELMRVPGILDVTASRYLPGDKFMTWGQMLGDKYVSFAAWPVEPNFLSFFKIPVEEGENFSHIPEGKDLVIFNRKMVQKFDLQQIVGLKDISCFRNEGEVIGIAKDVHFASLHHAVGPLAFVCGDDMWNEYIFIKIAPAQIRETIQYIKDCFEKFGSPACQITFLDEHIEQLYQREEHLSQVISLMGVITILIALAGIYGLILFNIRYKVKEIGVRKINGASEWQVMWMLNRIFVCLSGIGFLIACPLSYWLVDNWLSGYPYHTPIYWWVFLLAFMITLFVTFVTVGYRSWKAATSNPANAVKME